MGKISLGPSISIVSPYDGTVVFEPEVTLSGNTFSDTVSYASVERVKIFNNSILLTEVSVKQSGCGTDLPCFEWSANITIQDGANIIQVVAVDSDGRESSDADTIIVTKTHRTDDSIRPTVDLMCSSDSGISYSDNPCKGKDVLLRWEIFNVTQCTATSVPQAYNEWSSQTSIADQNGMQKLKIDTESFIEDTTFVLSCSGLRGEVVDRVIIGSSDDRQSIFNRLFRNPGRTIGRMFSNAPNIIFFALGGMVAVAGIVVATAFIVRSIKNRKQRL